MTKASWLKIQLEILTKLSLFFGLVISGKKKVAASTAAITLLLPPMFVLIYKTIEENKQC